MSLRLQTGLVTGASGTLGRLLVPKLADEGANLLLHYHKDIATAMVLRQRLAGACQATVSADLTSSEGVFTLLHALAAVPRLDFLVLAHGASEYAALPTYTAEQVARLVYLNLTSHLLIIRGVYDRLRHSHGTILLVGSISGQEGSSAEVPYAAAKAGLVGAARSLQKELADDRVRISVLVAGAFPSRMHGDRFIPATLPATTAEAVVDEIVRLLLRRGPLPLLRRLPAP